MQMWCMLIQIRLMMARWYARMSNTTTVWIHSPLESLKERLLMVIGGWLLMARPSSLTPMALLSLIQLRTQSHLRDPWLVKCPWRSSTMAKVWVVRCKRRHQTRLRQPINSKEVLRLRRPATIILKVATPMPLDTGSTWLTISKILLTQFQQLESADMDPIGVLHLSAHSLPAMILSAQFAKNGWLEWYKILFAFHPVWGCLAF